MKTVADEVENIVLRMEYADYLNNRANPCIDFEEWKMSYGEKFLKTLNESSKEFL